MIKGNFSSGKIVSMFMNNALPGGIPVIAFAVVDVREVAEAHMQCIKRDEAQGKRFLLSNQSMWMREIGEVLHRNFSPMGYNIPTNEAKYCFIKFAGWFRADAKKIATYWGRQVVTNN